MSAPDGDRLLISDLRVIAILGTEPQERLNPQAIVLNLEIGLDLRPAGESDDLTRSLSYVDLAEAARTLTERAARLTVEALAEDLARRLLAEAGVRWVRVRVEKPEAYAGARVGAEIVREKV